MQNKILKNPNRTKLYRTGWHCLLEIGSYSLWWRLPPWEYQEYIYKSIQEKEKFSACPWANWVALKREFFFDLTMILNINKPDIIGIAKIKQIWKSL